MAELIVATSRFQSELYSLLTPAQQRKVDKARDAEGETPRP